MLQEDSHAHHCEKLHQAVTSMEVSQFMENHCVVSDQQFFDGRQPGCRRVTASGLASL